MKIEIYKRLLAFARMIANECSICLRANSGNCSDCVARQAKILVLEANGAENEEQKIDYSFYTRVNKIRKILLEAGKPLLAKDIDLKHTCSPQLKCWTLNQMVFKGIIGRKFAFKSKTKTKKKVFFFYFIKDTK